MLAASGFLTAAKPLKHVQYADDGVIIGPPAELEQVAKHFTSCDYKDFGIQFSPEKSGHRVRSFKFLGFKLQDEDLYRVPRNREPYLIGKLKDITPSMITKAIAGPIQAPVKRKPKPENPKSFAAS